MASFKEHIVKTAAEIQKHHHSHGYLPRCTTTTKLWGAFSGGPSYPAPGTLRSLYSKISLEQMSASGKDGQTTV